MTDAQLAEEILKCKALSPGQLKAALDYQASVGGRLLDVLRKLGLVREEVLQTILSGLAEGGDSTDAARSEQVSFDASKLRVHKKLLEKLPAELVDRYGILFFFPPPGTRAILMSSVPEMGPEGTRKLQQLLGVDICGIDLPEEERSRFLPGGAQKPGGGKSAEGTGTKARGTDGGEPSGGAEGDAPAGISKPEKESGALGRPVGWEGPSRRQPLLIGDLENVDERILLRALVDLMVKKGLIDHDELAVQMSLVRHGQSVEAE